MKMKKYMAMGLGAIMAVGIAVSGVLPVSAVNNNENDAFGRLLYQTDGRDI